MGQYRVSDITIAYSAGDETDLYRMVADITLYSNADATYLYGADDNSAMYSISKISLPLWVHTHGYFAVPSEQIDGERTDFTFQGSYMEILLNGIPQLYTKTATGISLDEAPVVGDHLWGWWTI